jgi:Flp pilus assembly protein TadG
MRLRRSEQGAAAVELALVFPVLLLLVCGVVDFGRAYNAQITLATAARESVRVWALGGTTAQVQDRATAAAPGMTVTATVISGTPCTFGTASTVRVRTDFTYLTPMIKNLAPGLTSLSSDGVMRCGG